ncbi:MAG: FecR family protein [Sphingosinicella sp.]|uniref:FecR family protein n=1 Tax=Sphingosinicella sp. TaxID=1917971 RepID=UPI004037CC92
MAFLRTRGRIRREAADWLSRLGGGADEAGHAAFRRWYDADPRHAEAYDRMAAIWSAAGRLHAPRADMADEEQASRSSRRRAGFALAACLAGGIALISILLGSRWLPDPASDRAQSLATVVGEIREVVLPDGSRVVLDSGSHIETRFTASQRLLILRDGRARFFVAHESRPFVVRAASNEVTATGTVFDVSLIQDRLAVLLIEGSVEVRRLGGGGEAAVHRLAAGHKLVIAGQAPAVSQRATRGETLWPTHMLEFDETPLREAVALVNRYSRVQLALGDERIGNLRVSGAYRAGDVSGFARSLATAFHLRVDSRPDGTIVLVDPGAPRETPLPR